MHSATAFNPISLRAPANSLYVASLLFSSHFLMTSLRHGSAQCLLSFSIVRNIGSCIPSLSPRSCQSLLENPPSLNFDNISSKSSMLSVVSAMKDYHKHSANKRLVT